MHLIQIRILGPVAFGRNIHTPVGYRYDVPLDALNIPYIPMGWIPEMKEIGIPGVQTGFAHPEGYIGQVTVAEMLRESVPLPDRYIRGSFAEDVYDPGKGYGFRVLKPGTVFRASVSFEKKDREELEKRLQAIRRIGVISPEDGITGEVEVSLAEREDLHRWKYELNEKCAYTFLNLQILLVTPACFYRPCADGSGTELHVPGSVIREMLRQRMGERENVDWDRIICSNGYLTYKNERLLPTPLCASVVKLEREQLRYRMAPGKDPHLIEQDMSLQGTFAKDIHEHLVRIAEPERKHILSDSGEMYEALSEGQVFSATVYGNDGEIRAIAEYLNQNPSAHIGDLSDQGYGEVYCIIYGAGEERVPYETMCRSFEVCCLSDTLLLNDRGMPTCHAEDLAAEIEYVSGLEGKIRLTDRYTGVQADYSRNPWWDEDMTVARCFAKGSILRFEATEEAVDISPLLHRFIGERTEDGYGEIAAWPARGCYYRLTENLVCPRYEFPVPIYGRDYVFGARLADHVMTDMLKNRVYNIGAGDRGERENGVSPENGIPLDLLHMMRDIYSPLSTEAQLKQWYREGLTGGKGK